MLTEIQLSPLFSPEAIKLSYFRYKESKTDRFNPELIKIPMGADGIVWQDFEKNLDKNAENISRRVLNGTYLFYPFLEIEKEKPNGGTRILSIASIRDAIVQRQLYQALYESAEAMFSEPSIDKVSFAYRRSKSAPYAARLIWRSYSVNGYTHVLDADIRKFFDTLDHERLMALIDEWVGLETHARTLLWRYIRTDRVPFHTYSDLPNKERHFLNHKPKRYPRHTGVPQGGVLSGMLANLYLLEFDLWIINVQKKEIDLKYYRYADDFVILTRRLEEAEALKEPVAKKLNDLKLNIHSDKTHVRNINNEGLDFVGFQFTQKNVRAKPENIAKFKNRFHIALAKEDKLSSDSHEGIHRLRLAVKWCINPKILGPETIICETCGLPNEPRRNWMAFFASAVTDVKQLRKLDRWMRKQVCRYFKDHYYIRLGVRELRQARMRSLVGEYYRQRRTISRRDLCRCDTQ